MIPQAACHLIEAALPADAAPPHSRLWVAETDARPQLPGGDWDWQTPAALQAAPWTRRHDLAVLWLPADHEDRLLSRLRDLHARQLLVFVGVDNGCWPTQRLLGLALQRQARFQHEAQLIEAWSYDIRTYKAVPDWLNPRFWANPENWNKYRW